jgi:hypothetical protein
LAAFHQYVLTCLGKPGEHEPFRKANYSSLGSQTTLKNPPIAKRVVIVGSGGLSIGQAGEFDYSGIYVFI